MDHPITAWYALPEEELQWSFVRASGPGGQNVNKVSTAVKLRFDVGRSGMPPAWKARLRTLAGRRLTADGILVIDARRFRTQEQNRQDALERLLELLRKAAEKPRPRVASQPTRAARQARLDEKKRRSGIKSARKTIRTDGD